MQRIILTKVKKEGEDLQKEIHSFLSLNDTIPYYTKEDVLANPTLFVDVKFIFSTWYMPVFTEDEVRVLFPSLQAIFYAAGTVKYFAEPFLKQGVKVFSSASANSISVAEFTVAQILLANKGYFQAQKANKSFLWRWAFKRARLYAEKRKGNYNAKVGLIGCGRVATEVIRLLKPFHLDIFVYDPYVSTQRCNLLGVHKTDLDTLFESCDVISNHLPNIPETKGIINYKLLNKMHDYSTFINTGRGAQVIEQDLAKLLRKRSTICALLDVCVHEPPFPWSPILRRNNIFLSPHIAGSLGNENRRMVECSITAFNDFINNKSSKDEVTLEMLNNMA